MQAVSGAGYPGLSIMDMQDNVVPFISGEEGKVELEPNKVLGTLEGSGFAPASMSLSAHCNRVQVLDGHTCSVSLKLRDTRGLDKDALAAAVAEAFASFDTPALHKL